MQTSNPVYPAYLKLAGRPVVVVGGGRVASRRVQRLVAAGADITVVSPEISPELAALEQRGKVRWHQRRFQPADVNGMSLVYSAVGDVAIARKLHAHARANPGTLVNIAEDESLSDFHVPAVAARGEVQLAVSTGGRSPSRASVIRKALEGWLAEHESFLNDMERADPDDEDSVGEMPTPGKVYLVGAGPGDPELLTVRAVRLLENADVVYYDRLVAGQILEEIPGHVEKVYVGKEVGNAHRANIEELMVNAARAGRQVVRLKGGDPLIFARAAEEILALKKAGVSFEVVPGVSALSSVPAAAGIPLTCRRIASQVVVRSGHCVDNGEPAKVGADRSTSQAAHEQTTIVYFMATRRLAAIVAELRAEGFAGSTPVAVIQRGTLPDQKVILSELDKLPDVAAQEPVLTPALLVVGEMVRFQNLNEFLPVFEKVLPSERT
jgi:uroporphyrin-III C-methyltransferase/precorrin-2 dehydrogenase/sirohydrochlorin ferrochelatase